MAKCEWSSIKFKNQKVSVILVSSDLFCGEVCLAVMFPLCKDNGENSMGPAAGLIHVGGSNSSIGEHKQLWLGNIKMYRCN